MQDENVYIKKNIKTSGPKMKFIPEGIIPAMVTPFDKHDEIDENGTRRIINHILKGKVHGIFVSGSQGEFWALKTEEKERLFKITVDAIDGKIPVYAGTGAESTKETIELTQTAKDIGVDAASIITPYYIKPNDDELLNHYVKIANKVDLPILVYNNPARTGVHVSPRMVESLCEECANVVGIKDSSGDLTITSEYINRCGDRISVLAGRDTLILATLIYGGKGAIAACGNVVPGLIVKIYEDFISGELEGALEAQTKLAPLRLAFSLGSFPVVIKEALNMMGLSVGPCRDPISPISDESRRKLMEVLVGLGVEVTN